MTVDEVIASSSTAARVEDKRDTRIWDQRNLAVDTFVEDEIEFEVGYYFDRKTKRLTMLDMNLDDSKCDEAYSNAQLRYGEGTVKVTEAPIGRVKLVATTTQWNTPDSTEIRRFSDLNMGSGAVRFCKILVMSRDLSPE